MQSTSLAVDPHAAEPTLRDQDAWEIAMAWQPQLQGKVRLILERDEPIDSIVQRYAWVRLDDPRPLVEAQSDDVSRHQVTSIKRAVMLTWHALASCPGFSGTENGAFWKRVLSVLQEKPKQPPRPPTYRGCFFGDRDRPKSVTDAYGFFDGPGHVFPRFRVQTPYALDQDFSALLTPDGPVLAPQVKDTLDTLLTRLEPYRRAATPPRAIDVSLCVCEFFGKNENRAITALVDAINRPRIDPHEPVFHIREITFRGSVQFSSNKQIDDFLQLVRDVDVNIGHIDLSPLLNNVSPQSRATLLYAFLRIDGYGVQARVMSFDFPRHYVNDAVFHALMSALPFATSVQSLAFGTECMERDGAFEQADLPWIAYAIFHPCADSSSWRHVDIDRVTLTAHSTHVLTAMARGNNLLALLNGTPPESNAYYSARLSAETVVLLEPRLDGDMLCVAPVTGVTVDVCGISSLDRATWGEWVAVIVRAYGLGWVRGRDLHDARAHAPSTHGLSGLRLRRMRNTRVSGKADDTLEAPLHVLPPLGRMLTYLNVDTYTDMPAATREAILCACPLLKTLVVSHDGSLWSAPLREPALLAAQLEELELSVYYNHAQVAAPTLDHLATSLRNLRALRLRVYDMQVDQLQASSVTLQRLLRHVPTLKYLHWRNAANDSTIPYPRSLEWTPRALIQLDLTDATYLYAHGSLSASCAAAFLSAVVWQSERADHEAASLGRLVDRGVLTSILQFATSRVRRRIHIEPNDKNWDGVAPLQLP